jgi:hypothetical protein
MAVKPLPDFPANVPAPKSPLASSKVCRLARPCAVHDGHALAVVVRQDRGLGDKDR